LPNDSMLMQRWYFLRKASPPGGHRNPRNETVVAKRSRVVSIRNGKSNEFCDVGAGHQHPGLKQPRARVVLEQLCIANIAPQGVHRLVTAYIHHLED
jgi:hypothetical protein